MLASLSAVIVLGLQVPKEILLVLNKAEDTVSLIDTKSQLMMKTLPTGHGPNEVMVSPNGDFATIANMGTSQKADKTITVLSMPGGNVDKTIDLGEYSRPHGMAWIDNARFVVTTHAPEALHLVNVATGKVEQSVAAPGRGLHMVVLSPDKKMAYASCVFDQKMVAFDLVNWEVAYSVECGPRAEGISVSPDGKTVAVGNVGDDSVTLIDTEKKSAFKTLKGNPGPIRTFFVNSGKQMMVSAVNSGEIVVWNTADWTEFKRIPVVDLPGMDGEKGAKHPPMNYAVSADGKRVFVVVVTGDCVAEIDLTTWTVTRTHKSGKLPDGIAIWSAK